MMSSSLLNYKNKNEEIYIEWINPEDNRDIILKILSNIWFRFEDITVKTPYRLVIFNNIEYLVKIVKYNSNDNRLDYYDKYYENGYYIFEILDTIKVYDIVKNLFNYRIAINYTPRFIDKIFDRFTGSIKIDNRFSNIYNNYFTFTKFDNLDVYQMI